MARDDRRAKSQEESAEALEAVEAWVRAQMGELESQNASLKGRVRLLTAGLLLAFGGVAAVAWQGRSPDQRAQEGMLEVSGLVLRDDSGVARAELSLAEDGGPVLALRDQAAVDRLRLTVLGGGSPGLAFSDRDGNRRIVLALLPDETSNMVFADRGGTMRAVLGLSQDDRSNIVFADRGGVPRVGLGVDGQGTATVMLPPEQSGDSTSDGGQPPGVEQ